MLWKEILNLQEWMEEKVEVAYFKKLSRHYTSETEENYKILSKNSWSTSL
jgi:hypothetical protein